MRVRPLHGPPPSSSSGPEPSQCQETLHMARAQAAFFMVEGELTSNEYRTNITAAVEPKDLLGHTGPLALHGLGWRGDQEGQHSLSLSDEHCLPDGDWCPLLPVHPTETSYVVVGVKRALCHCGTDHNRVIGRPRASTWHLEDCIVAILCSAPLRSL